MVMGSCELCGELRVHLSAEPAYVAFRQQQLYRMKQKESAQATGIHSPPAIYSEYSLVVYHQCSSAVEGGVEISNGWTSNLSDVRELL